MKKILIFNIKRISIMLVACHFVMINVEANDSTKTKICFEQYSNYAEYYKNKKKWSLAKHSKELAELYLSKLKVIDPASGQKAAIDEHLREINLLGKRPMEFKFKTIEELNYYCD